MPTRDPYDTDARAHRWWLSVGLAGVIAVAALLLGATLWLSETEGPLGAPATGPAGAVDQALPAAVRQITLTPAPLNPTPATPGPPSGPAGEASAQGQLPPVPLTEEVAPVPGVVFTVDALDAVGGGGAASAPGLQLTLTVRNDTDAPLALNSAAVELYAGAARQAAGTVAEPNAVALPGTIPAGATGSGVYVFTVPAELRDQVRIVVGYAPGIPVVVFEGAAPG